MERVPLGIAQGRFQVIHLGHMEYLLAAKQRADFLIIGISDPDPTRTYTVPADPLLGNESSIEPVRTLQDPCHAFTYYERMLMIRESLFEAGVDGKEFSVVPFPIHFPKLLKYYIPMDAVLFATIYDTWGREKLRIWDSLGLRYEILWERDLSERMTTGTEVRRKMTAGERWEHLVPPVIVKIIQDLGIIGKIGKTSDPTSAHLRIEHPPQAPVQVQTEPD